MNHFVSFTDISVIELNELLNLAADLKYQVKNHIEHHLLRGKTLGMIFAKSSTRTRVSFEVGMYQLGGQSLFLSSQDIQLGRGESVQDTAAVLSRFVDGIMIRTYSHNDIKDLVKYGSVPVINGLSDLMHPCQALADLMTIREHKGELSGLKLAYLGDGNNVANSLLHACSMAGMHISVACPKSYQPDSVCINESKSFAEQTGGSVTITDDPLKAIANADVVYTDTWISMGQEAEKAERLRVFIPYQVNQALMEKANPDAIFMHCLPAYRGYEVTEDVIDGPCSVVYDEAENRLHAQKALLVRLMK